MPGDSLALRLTVDVLPPCRSFREKVLAASELWKTGELRKTPKVLSDITHGSVFRESILSALSTDPLLLCVGLILGYDDLELLNTLGVCRGKKKVACFYVAVANLSATERFEMSNICILMLVLEKVLKRCGAVRVVAGASSINGEVDAADYASFGAQVRASLAGEAKITVSPCLAWPPVLLLASPPIVRPASCRLLSCVRLLRVR